jgi:hypothetical protein
MSRNALHYNLKAAEVRTLRGLIDDISTDKRIVQRCRIILMTEKGVPLQEIADVLDLSKTTVNTWRQKFLACRLEGLVVLKSPGRFPGPVKEIRPVHYSETDAAVSSPAP